MFGIKKNTLIHSVNLCFNKLLKWITGMLGFTVDYETNENLIRHETNEKLISRLLLVLDKLAEAEKQNRIRDEISKERDKISQEWGRRLKNEEGYIRTDPKMGKGMLTAFRYHYHQEGRSKQRRQCVLKYIIKYNLPPVTSRDYMGEWGAPGTEKRFIRLRTSIQAKVNGESRNMQGIAVMAWKEDLEFIKKYNPGGYQLGIFDEPL
tara:strand:- start:22 stop:642 length:621 start_codon:yes stop_codon:yes gene_type:complete